MEDDIGNLPSKAPPPSTEPDPAPPPARYRIVAASRDKTPSGFLYVRGDSDADGTNFQLLVATNLALVLHSESMHAEREALEARAAQVAARQFLGDARAPYTAAAKPKRSEHFVDSERLDAGWRAPTSPGWIKVWDPKVLREAVDRHNSHLGSADTADRARDAAMFRAVLAAGPWRRCTVPRDVEACVSALQEELPHLGEFVGLLSDQLRLADAGALTFAPPPVLLVGAPGVGKTYAVQRAADLIGLAFRSIDMSCAQTNSALHGSERHWANARPGALFELVALGGSANPLILLDELDKTRTSAGGYNPLGPLHLALEATTARATRDLCTHIEFDASHVLYVGTANSLRGIPDSLLSRFHLMHCVQPDLRQSMQIARRIAEQVVQATELCDFDPISPRLVAPLAELSPRLLRRALERAVARAVAAGRRRLHDTDLVQGNRPSNLH